MQHRWWLSMPEAVRHSIGSTLEFIVLTGAAIFGSKAVEVASLEIKSKFVVHVLVLLEYAVVVLDAYCLLKNLFKLAVRKN